MTTIRHPARVSVIAATLAAIIPIAGTPSRAQPPAPRKVVAPPEKKGPTRDQLAAEATPIVRALFVAEIRFMRVAAGASDEQARRMARDARRPIEAAVARCVDEQLKHPVPSRGIGQVDWGAFYLSLQKDLAAIAEARLTPEQRDRLRIQIARRDDFRKRVILGNLALGLDRELLLTASQRDQIAGSLASHWDPRWENGLDIEDLHSLPQIPDPVIVPFLTPAQKAAWAKLEKKSAAPNAPTAAMLTIEVASVTAEGEAAGDDLAAEATPKR